jgi:hypothetical protein
MADVSATNVRIAAAIIRTMPIVAPLVIGKRAYRRSGFRAWGPPGATIRGSIMHTKSTRSTKLRPLVFEIASPLPEHTRSFSKEVRHHDGM